MVMYRECATKPISVSVAMTKLLVHVSVFDAGEAYTGCLSKLFENNILNVIL